LIAFFEHGRYSVSNPWIEFYFMFNAGRKAGCVAMKTGVAGGLWDVLSCEEKAKFVCKHWAEGVTRPPEPTTTPEPKCPENWGTTSKTSMCFKVRITRQINKEPETSKN
jgi:hypothetical protein